MYKVDRTKRRSNVATSQGDRIATTAGGERSASRPQSKALWELSPLTRGTARPGPRARPSRGIIPADAGNGLSRRRTKNDFRTNRAWRGHLNGGGQGQGSKIS